MKKQDPRIKRTRALIINTFYELSKRKSFEEISIADITKEAEINRSTFYYHFIDKFDLIDTIKNEAISNDVFKGLESEVEINQTTINYIMKAIIDSQTGLSFHCQKSYDTLKPQIEEDMKTYLTTSLNALLNKIYGDHSDHLIKATFWSWGIYGLAMTCIRGEETIDSALPKVMKIMNVTV
ncbi:TetR/AcrR family transcriptional regulator [Alkalicoccobacillus gibsonii]|uniref:TetR/AcrR family transcriptional regulator n=1 Tax=Alkalicoccobacillus gibsonii TaxID=79881 RepID=UPI0019342A58|nr:TetR/AcrR family transcriptional regulator [Alkalicoccobacillus gibsonii]MBM0066816.1 TetR/AcrR family transcriptional regulator [Alkalicoccobacillus gibsonii]